jgi:hypothetical protein
MKNDIKKLLVEKAIVAIRTEEPSISWQDIGKVFSAGYTAARKQIKPED